MLRWRYRCVSSKGIWRFLVDKYLEWSAMWKQLVQGHLLSGFYMKCFFFSYFSRDLSRKNPSRHDGYYQNSRDNSCTSYKYTKYTSRKKSDSDSKRRHRQRQKRHRSKSSDLVSVLIDVICNLFCLIRVAPDFEFHHTCVIRWLLGWSKLNHNLASQLCWLI